jgi:hypothetical protein
MTIISMTPCFITTATTRAAAKATTATTTTITATTTRAVTTSDIYQMLVYVGQRCPDVQGPQLPQAEVENQFQR